MPSGYQRIYKDVSYLKKDHFCPNCNEKLQKVTVSKVVNSASPEAKDYDFSNVDTFMIGDVKFVWDELECPACQTHLTADQMKEIEGIPVKDNSTLKIVHKMLYWIVFALFIAYIVKECFM